MMIQSDEIKIERCPFCGSDFVGVEREKDFPPKFYVRCNECFAQGGWDDKVDVAINNWNSRRPNALSKLCDLTWKIGQLEEPVNGTWKDAKNKCYDIVEQAHADIASGSYLYE